MNCLLLVHNTENPFMVIDLVAQSSLLKISMASQIKHRQEFGESYFFNNVSKPSKNSKKIKIRIERESKSSRIASILCA